MSTSDVMANAREDLAGNLNGTFSPEDWERILQRARARCEETGSWPDVIREFHRERYWGFVPNYKPPKRKIEDENLGTRFIWYAFRSFLLSKVAVVWFGALWTAYGDPIYGWCFIGWLIFMLGNYGYFLYRYGPKHRG